MKFFLMLGLACLVGIASSVPQTRILGSTEVAKEKDLPYQVAILNLGFHCSGALVANQWVLTAASCVSGLSEQIASVRVGSIYHNKGGEVIKIAKIVLNPHYDRSSLSNDIALVKLVKPATLSSTVKIAQLAQPSDLSPKGQLVQISGWGIESLETGVNPHVLKKVEIGFNRNNECEAAYEDKLELPARIFCAGDINNGGAGVCEGDVGGPAYSLDYNKLYGIASFAVDCANGPNKPSVFTDVRQYGDWIQSVTTCP